MARSVFLSLCLGWCAHAQALDDSELSSLKFVADVAASRTAAFGLAHAAADPLRGDPNEFSLPEESGPPPEEILAAITNRLATIASEATSNGARSSALIEEFRALATLYREAGDHPLAIGALENAVNLSRINNGLHSLDQSPLLLELMASSGAAGNHTEADAVAKRLIELVNRNPTDPRAASILEALGDREIATTRRLLRDRLPPQLTIGAGPDLGPALPTTGPPTTTRRAALASLRRGRELYRYAIGRAVGSGDATVADLFALEEKILASFYYEASDPELSPEPGLQEKLMCELGESAFMTHAVNTSRLSPSPTDFALALIGLGDWRLLCSNNGEALRTYRTAREVLRDYGVPADVVSLDGPGELLVFDSQPAGAKAAQDYRGYVDVSLVIGKYGDARKIDIVGQSASTPKAVEKRLKSYLASNRFRPRFVDGELVRGDRVALRYYYDY